MKKIFTTSVFLIALLAIGLIGVNNNNSIGNSFAQMDSEDSPMMMEEDMIGNSFAQMDSEDSPMMMEEDMEMMEMDDDEGMMMTTMSNQSEGMKMMKLNGTIDVKTTIAEAFKSKVTTDIIGAIQTAQASVGANSFVKKAELTPAHGYLVYKMMVVDENMKKYKVIVDPGNGQVLMKKEVTWYDEHKMKYGGEKEKYDKYGHDDYDKKEILQMTKDKEY